MDWELDVLLRSGKVPSAQKMSSTRKPLTQVRVYQDATVPAISNPVRIVISFCFVIFTNRVALPPKKRGEERACMYLNGK